MRRLGLLVIVALAVGAPAASAKLPKFSSNDISPGKSIGGVKIGQSVKSAKTAWGGESRATQCGSDTCTFADSDSSTAVGKNGRARFNFTDSKITSIYLDGGEKSNGDPVYTGPLLKLKTSKKIKLGSSLADLKEAYGGVKKVSSTTWELYNKQGVTTQFVVLSNRVHDIYVTIY